VKSILLKSAGGFLVCATLSRHMCQDRSSFLREPEAHVVTDYDFKISQSW